MGGDKITQGTGGQKNEDGDDETHKSEIVCSVDVTSYWMYLKEIKGELNSLERCGTASRL